jgi:hypothetical protein
MLQNICGPFSSKLKILQKNLNSPASKFDVEESCIDMIGTVFKMSKIFLLKLIDSDSGR